MTAATNLKRKAVAFYQALLFSLSPFVSTAMADVLVMQNGDRLTGEVVARSSDSLQFKTPYAGIITIKWEQIKTVETEQTMTLQIANEQIIKSTLLENLEDKILLVVDEDTGQNIQMEQDLLTAINPQPWIFGEGFLFTGRINLTLKYERGNNEVDEVDSDGEIELRRKQHRLNGKFSYENDKKYAAQTKNKWKVGSSYDYFLPDSWQWGVRTFKRFVGFTLLAESNEFAELTLRMGAGPHVGYQFYEGHAINLKTGAGFLRISEEFQSSEGRDYWAPGWMLDFDTFLLTDILQFYHRQNGFWGYDVSDKLVWTSWTGFRVPLWGGFVASTELEYEFDSEPPEGVETTDITTRVKLGYSW